MTNHIPTWRERCEAHTANHSGVASDYTIRLLMKEEINDLRAALEQRSRRQQARRITGLIAENTRLRAELRAVRDELAELDIRLPSALHREMEHD